MKEKEYLQINKNRNYMFLDTEFNSTGNNEDDIKNDINEILSIGYVITDYNLNIIEEFHKYTKPINFTHVLDNCSKITGIEDKDILFAKDFKTIFLEIFDKIQKFNIDKIFTYGIMDKVVIERDCIKSEIDNEKTEYFISHIFDVQPYLNSILPYPTTNKWGMKQVCKYFNIDFYGMHNSLSDAIILLLCTQKYQTTFRNPYYYNRLKEVAMKNMTKNKNTHKKEGDIS